MSGRVLVGLLTVVVAIMTACAVGGDRAPTTVGDGEARELLDAALEAMGAADSYRATYRLPVDDADAELTGVRWEIAYQRPDSYHYLIVAETGAGSDVLEAVLIGDRFYGRGCVGIDSGCDAWEEDLRPDIPTFSLSTLFVHGWPLVALEQASDLSLDADGTTVRGRTRLDRAVVENIRRVAEASGLAGRIRACDTAATAIAAGGDRALPTPRADGLACDQTGYEDFFGPEADADLETADAVAAPFVATVSSSTHHVLRIEIPGEITIPLGIAPQAPGLVIEYADFGEVQLEAPQ